MRLFIHKRNIQFIIYFIFSISLYIFSPINYNWFFNLVCGIIFFLSTCALKVSQDEKNYFDFETIFLLSYFFCFFVYPIFIYVIDPEYFFMFSFDFDHDKINKGTALALVGAESFILGSSICYTKFNHNIQSKENIINIPTKLIHSITVLLFIVFIMSGGYSSYKSLYNNGGTVSGIYSYIIILFVSVYILSVSSEFVKAKKLVHSKNILPYKSLSKLFILFILTSSLIFLSAGSRTVMLQIMLSYLGLYSLFFFKINLKQFVVISLIGAILLTSITYTRAGNQVSIVSFWDLFMDLIINNRSTYFALSFTEENGYTCGVSMLGYILKCIPFSQKIVCNLFGIDEKTITSAMIVTRETLGDDPELGLGTNIIADIYLAFGFVGVLLFMYALGYYSKKSYLYSIKGHIYYLFFYTSILSVAIYMVRSEYFYSLNLILWAFIIYNVFKHYKKKTEFK